MARRRETTISTLFILTGPESCGKTTLATALSESLEAPLVKEASRDYLNQKLAADGNFRYDESHLLDIARHQDHAEQVVRAGSPGLVVCDTDLLVLIIWSEVRFGKCHPWILDAFAARIADSNRHYFLCDCDIPWQPDPLRESPDSRPELFELYRQKLEYYGLRYTVVSGDREHRLATALALF